MALPQSKNKVLAGKLWNISHELVEKYLKHEMV
jgi:hypothetical protein